MTTEKISAEQIAAFAEGRLRGRARRRVIAHLAESAEAYQLFVDMVDDLFPVPHPQHMHDRARDVEQLKSAFTAPRIQTGVRTFLRRTWQTMRAAAWHPSPRYSIAAGGLAVIIGTTLLVNHMADRDEFETTDPTVLAQRFRVTTPTLAESSYATSWDRPGWAATRGVASSLTDSQIAFRLGVRVVDLAVAIETGTVNWRAILTAEQDALLAQIEFATLEQATLHAIDNSISVDEMRRAVEVYDVQLRSLLPSSSYEVGKWVGAARLAAIRGDQDFFASAETLDFLARRRWHGLPADGTAIMDDLARSAQRGLTDEDWRKMPDTLAALIRIIGG